MTLSELDRALRQLRLSGMAAVLEIRLRQAQTERLRWSPTNCSAGRIASLSGATSSRAFAIRSARSTPLTLPSTPR